MARNVQERTISHLLLQLLNASLHMFNAQFCTPLFRLPASQPLMREVQPKHNVGASRFILFSLTLTQIAADGGRRASERQH